MSSFDKAPRVCSASPEDLKAVEQKASSFKNFLNGAKNFPIRFFEIDPRMPASLELHAHFLEQLDLPEIVPPALSDGEELLETIAENAGRAIARQVIFLDRNPGNYSIASYQPVEGSMTAYYFGQVIRP